MTCVNCGAALRGKQTKYCSRRCGKAHYQRVHPERASAANLKSRAKHPDTWRAYRELNRERINERARRRRILKPDLVRAAEARRRGKRTLFMREYNKRPEVIARRQRYNREKRLALAEKHRQYVARNRARMRELYSRHHQRRRAQVAETAIERIDRYVVFKRARWRCQLCGRRTPKRLLGQRVSAAPTLDHIVPLSRGGAHTYANLQCACWKCNSTKRAHIKGQPTLF